MAEIRPIGKPENASESKAIAYFAKHLPDEYVVFHNLELSTQWGLPYEFDIIIIGEYAIYNIEIKGYQGQIQGNANEWRLASGVICKSPIPLNNKKSKIISERLAKYNSLLQRVWVQPLIVLTDDRTSLKLNDEQSGRVLHLSQAVQYIMNPSNLPIKSSSTSAVKNQIVDAIAKQFAPLRRRNEIGDYHVVEIVGKNNLYTTFLAEHRILNTNRFALKVYSFDVYTKPDTRQKQEDRIKRDALLLHKLGGHHNVVRAHTPFYWEDNKLVLPMEWIDGYSLKGLMESGERFSYQRASKIIREIATGLQHAHASGVIHRDLTPKNIIVPEQGSIKLVNFDCAKVESSDMRTIATQLDRRLDQRYVAPEVWINASAASAKSDIYALGVIAFELLTGCAPYEKAKDIFEAKGLPQLPSKFNSELSKDVDEIVARMCVFKPDERYGNMSDVLTDWEIIS